MPGPIDGGDDRASKLTELICAKGRATNPPAGAVVWTGWPRVGAVRSVATRSLGVARTGDISSSLAVLGGRLVALAELAGGRPAGASFTGNFVALSSRFEDCFAGVVASG